MKFVVSTSKLLKELQSVSGVISSSNVLPILEDFLFVIENSQLTVFATDLETSMSTSLDIDAKETGKVAIPARIIMDTLKTLPEQPLTFTIEEETHAIEITSENGKYKLSGENGEDFPKIPEAEEVSSIQMPANILNKAINKTLFAVSNDELRPAMTGVLFQFDQEGVTFVSTDAHKLVKFHRSDAKSEQASSFIVPKKALNLLKNSLPNEDTNVEVSYNNSNAFFSFDSIKLICRLVDAKYPDYNAVIPDEKGYSLKIGRDELQNSLRRISIFSNKTTHQAVLKVSGSDLQISAQDIDFANEANERLQCNYEGEDIEIGFNAKFLIEMLTALDTEETDFRLSGSSKAGLLLPIEQEQNEDLLMLIMPVMLNQQ